MDRKQKTITRATIMKEMSQQIKREEAKVGRSLHSSLDSIGDMASSLKSNMYRMLNSLQGSLVGVFMSRIGDGHMGNMARKDNLAEKFFRNFLEITYYEECNADLTKFKNYLENWVREVGQAMGLQNGVILDDAQAIKQGFVTQEPSDFQSYKTSRDRGYNDIRILRKNGEVEFIKYSIPAAHKKKLENFLKTNLTLKKIREGMREKEGVVTNKQDLQQATKKPKQEQDLFIEGLLEACNANNAKSIELFERFLGTDEAKNKEDLKVREANLNLADLYMQLSAEKNNSCKETTLKTIRYLEKGLTTHHPLIQHNLGVQYIHINQYQLAKNYLKEAAEQGITESRDALLALHFNNQIKLDKHELRNFLEGAAQEGNQLFQYNLAISLIKAKEFDRDIKTAKKWLKKAANQGYLQAKQVLTQLELVEHFQKDAKRVEVLYNSATNYLEKGEFEKALPHIKEAAELGDAKSQFTFGIIHMNGDGVEQNHLEAYKWLKKAADNGFQQSIKVLDRVKQFLKEVNIEGISRGDLTNLVTAKDISGNLIFNIFRNSNGVIAGLIESKFTTTNENGMVEIDYERLPAMAAEQAAQKAQAASKPKTKPSNQVKKQAPEQKTKKRRGKGKAASPSGSDKSQLANRSVLTTDNVSEENISHIEELRSLVEDSAIIVTEDKDNAVLKLSIDNSWLIQVPKENLEKEFVEKIGVKQKQLDELLATIRPKTAKTTTGSSHKLQNPRGRDGRGGAGGGV